MSQTNPAVRMPMDDRLADLRRARMVALLYLAYFCASLYWALSATGPARWLAELQGTVGGPAYSPRLAVLLLNLPVVVPLVLWSSRPPARSRPR
ncbi:MAG TPA: hypothetical protein VFS05_05615 [Gemmatimonadaceae bacterium]|nr:hypothetical protein [Gemmatimonadaceae bacterium]